MKLHECQGRQRDKHAKIQEEHVSENIQYTLWFQHRLLFGCILEATHLDLVDGRRDRRELLDLLEVLDAVVGDSDGSRLAVLAKALKTFPKGLSA